ncbi:MAG TPA: tetratricopeptide repeat protein [Coleofasciculaceae cyanobacterium]|jgi:tetratricopeptide (TPR) repeat protein
MAGEQLGYQPGMPLKFHPLVQRDSETQNSQDYESLARFIESFATPASSRYQLPPDLEEFTGRHAKIDDAIALLKQANFLGRRSPIMLAMSGRAGVGKSTLAIHVAHQMRQTFADAQLYINLRGNDSQPLAPADALASFLRAFGLSDAAIPVDLEERSQLFQSFLIGKRMLILLDNAADEAQVRSLLPTHGVCAVLITSRKRLADLSDVTLLNLLEMSELEASELLQKFVAASLIQSQPDVGMSAVNLCSRLPLAIGTFGHLLRYCSDLPLREAVSQLADVRKRLKQLNLSHTDIRTNFMLSYRQLQPTAARLLRLLGLLVESSFSLDLASVLLESDLAIAKESIQQLITLHLLKPLAGSSSVKGKSQRFRFSHDLIRLFVRGQLATEESAEERQAARLRVCNWSLNMTQIMKLGLEPGISEEIALALSRKSRQSLVVLEQKVRLGTLNWFADERLNLLTAVEWAYQAEAWEQVIALTDNSINFYSIRMCWSDWERTHRLALDAAKHLDHQPQQAAILNNLGNAYLRQRQWDKAEEYYEQSLTLLKSLPDRVREAQTWVNLGILYIQREQLNEAITLWHKALTQISAYPVEQRSLRQWMQGVDKSIMEQAVSYERDRQASQGLIQTLGTALKRFIFE